MRRVGTGKFVGGKAVNCNPVSPCAEAGRLCDFAKVQVANKSEMSFGVTVSITMVWYDWGDTKCFIIEAGRNGKCQLAYLTELSI